MAENQAGTGEPNGGAGASGGSGSGGSEAAEKLVKLEAELTKTRQEAAERRTKAKELTAQLEERDQRLATLEAAQEKTLPEAEKRAKDAERSLQALKAENTKLKTASEAREARLAKKLVKESADRFAKEHVADDYQELFGELAAIRGKVADWDDETIVFVLDGKELSAEDYGKLWLDQKGDKARKATRTTTGGGAPPAQNPIPAANAAARSAQNPLGGGGTAEPAYMTSTDFVADGLKKAGKGGINFGS